MSGFRFVRTWIVFNIRAFPSKTERLLKLTLCFDFIGKYGMIYVVFKGSICACYKRIMNY